MNIQILAPRRSAHVAMTAALLLFAALPSGAPRAMMDVGSLDAARLDSQQALSMVLADQGNRALASIREDARDALKRLPLPALPAYAVDAPAETLARAAP